LIAKIDNGFSPKAAVIVFPFLILEGNKLTAYKSTSHLRMILKMTLKKNLLVLLKIIRIGFIPLGNPTSLRSGAPVIFCMCSGAHFLIVALCADLRRQNKQLSIVQSIFMEADTQCENFA
jgi:hypothetical protein